MGGMSRRRTSRSFLLSPVCGHIVPSGAERTRGAGERVGLAKIDSQKKGTKTKDCPRCLWADELPHAAGEIELPEPHQGIWGRRLNVERQSTTNVGRAHVEERRPPRFFEIRAGFARSACLGTGRTDALPAPFVWHNVLLTLRVRNHLAERDDSFSCRPRHFPQRKYRSRPGV